jgi:hypothetical protein
MRKITFFTTVPGVEDAYPIIPAGDYKPSWVSAARDSYLKRLKLTENSGEKMHHVYRCPGIFDIMSKGYIVQMPWDVLIETMGDGEDFKWSIPSSEIARLYEGNVVAGHMFKGVAESLPHKPGALRSLIKFNSPWHVVAPPGVKFIIIPIPYDDTHVFEHVMGILDPALSTELNPQGYWKVLKGHHLLKAGTPMMQIVPLTDEEFEIEVKSASAKEIEWVKKRTYFFNLSYAFKRNLMKVQYIKHFFGKS